MTDRFDRTPYCHKIRYGITGAPIITDDEMDGSHAPGIGLTPTLIELVYSAPRDGKPARISASVTGTWTRFGEPADGQVTTHFDNGPDAWPAWLAEEARLHDPDAEQAEARERYMAGLRRADEINNSLMEEVQRYAEGTERPVLWSVYNEMHKRALKAEAEAHQYRTALQGVARREPAAAPAADQAAEPSAAVHKALRSWAYAAGHNEQGMDAAARRMYELVARDVRRLADETPDTEPKPRRGDTFEAWLKAQRDAAADYPEAYQAADGLLDLYRLHADTGTPLGEHVCEGRVVKDCECLEQPAAGARQDGAQR